jgi:hypothetical protein
VSNGCNLTFSTPAIRTIRATYNGNSSFNASTSPGVSVHVVDFSLSVTPTSQALSGRKATYVLSVAAVNGSPGTVSLSCSGGPPNTTCAVSPNTVTLSASTATRKATVTVPTGASSGTYTITFTGSFGSATRSTTASLIVQ